MNWEQLIFDAARVGISDGLKTKLLSPYDRSGMSEAIDAAISSKIPALRGLMDEALAKCLDDGTFREEIKSAVRQHLARLLVSRFGGEMERVVNELKSNPTTRAKITLAIDQIVKEGV